MGTKETKGVKKEFTCQRCHTVVEGYFDAVCIKGKVPNPDMCQECKKKDFEEWMESNPFPNLTKK